MIKRKTCTLCKEPKAFGEFHRDKYSKDGRDHRCKHCVKAQRWGKPDTPYARGHKKAAGKWLESNPEKARARTQAADVWPWCTGCGCEEHLEQHHARYSSPKTITLCKECHRMVDLRRREQERQRA